MPNAVTKYNMPKGFTGVRTLLRSYAFLRNPTGFISKNMQLYGNSYSAWLPQYPYFIITQDAGFINHVLKDNHTNYHKSPLTAHRVAEYLGNGMLFLNGESWLRQRRLAQPAFHRERIQGLFDIVIKTIDRFLQNITPGNRVDMYPITHSLAFNVVLRSLFDINLSAGTMKLLNDHFNDIQSFIIKDINQPFRRPFYSITGAEKNALKKSAEIRNVFRDIIQQRRLSNSTYNDLLDMLLHSTYEDTGLPMNDDQVIDELMVFVTAGHETTANTLGWMLYLLSVNPLVLTKVQQVVQQISIQDSFKNEYLTAVIYETMRLYPPAWLTDRVALQDDSYGEYVYPKGTIIIAYFYGAHRTAQQWENAGSFEPERFIDEDGKLKKYKNFFPFGAGPRLCIGNHFAMAEMAFFMHTFFNRYTITPTGIEPAQQALLTLRPGKVLLNVSRL